MKHDLTNITWTLELTYHTAWSTFGTIVDRLTVWCLTADESAVLLESCDQDSSCNDDSDSDNRGIQATTTSFKVNSSNLFYSDDKNKSLTSINTAITELEDTDPEETFGDVHVITGSYDTSEDHSSDERITLGAQQLSLTTSESSIAVQDQNKKDLVHLLAKISQYFNITDRYELGHMTDIFLHKYLSKLFFLSIIIYLSGDLVIYNAMMSKSLREFTW